MKRFIVILVLLSHTISLISQINFNTRNSHNLEMKFLFQKVETPANKSFFNIITINNNSDFSFNGKLKLNKPLGWSFIGDEELDIQISAKDSLRIPLRVIPSKDVMGEIAYALVAALFDKNNVSIKSEYCFVNIPRISDLKIVTPNQILYFDNKTNTAQFTYKISNKGNVNELIQLSFSENDQIGINKNKLESIYSFEYNIPAHTDTVIEIKVNLLETKTEKDFFKVEFESHTSDSLYKDAIWINKVDNSYEHLIPQENKCAILEFVATDILSTRNPRYALMLKGSVLLKNKTDFYYYYRNQNLEEDVKNYLNDRGYIGVKNKYFQLQAGTLQNLNNEYVFGFGGQAKINLNSFFIDGHYATNEFVEQEFFGGKAGYSFSGNSSFEIGYSENNLDILRNYSQILYSGLKLNFINHHRILVKTYLNNTKHKLNGTFEKQGLAILGNYSMNYKRIKLNARLEYGSPDYSGISRGKTQLSSYFLYMFGNRDYLNLSYSKYDLRRIEYINDVQQPIQESYSDNYTVLYNKFLNKNISLEIGPGYAEEKFNLPFVTTTPGTFFKTNTIKGVLGLKYNNVSEKLYIKPKIVVGRVNQLSEINSNLNIEAFNSYNFTLFSRYRNFNLYMQYKNGADGIFNKYLYFNSGYLTKWLFVMPSYTQYFFKEKMKLDLRSNYRYDIGNESRYTSLTTHLQFFMPYSLTLWLLNSITTNSRKNVIDNSSVRYNTVFFEAGIRKEFACRQPRFQYHDLSIVFFKDLNGNRIKEDNEPGLRNVLATIEQDFDVKEQETNKDFISKKFLTGPDGNMTYNNIVNGVYKLKYVLIGDMIGNFNREEMEESFIIERDKTVFIPYLENNRIVGKIILNRDPLSSLGNIDISNIRVIAEDTKGHSYSALTDKEGNFIIYAPVTDHYVVKVNNIFYESFDLQQAEFVVKFNGYKQFEVNFVFNEKKRQINFDTEIDREEDEELVMDELKAIRKTTLSGKIRDAISLEPVGASIEIIDNITNNVISSAISNKLNGNYSISYVANENYRIVVKAPEYSPYSENLYIEQVISIQNIAKDIMLKKE